MRGAAGVERAKYLVLGNSAAAVAAVEGLRTVDRRSEIVLVAKERRHAYSRPLISHLLAGEIGEERMRYRPLGLYEEQGVRAELGVEIVSVDAGARVAVAADGRRFGFERLLVATGGRPVVPEIEGLPARSSGVGSGADSTPARGVFTFTSWDDAAALDAHVRSGAKSAVVVGGGLIGVKAAEALRARGLEVLVVELAGRLLPLALDETASRLAAGAVARAGVGLVTGATVGRVRSEGGAVSGVRLTTGREVACDTLVLAIGVVPETGLVQGSGIALGKGIVIDRRSATNVEGVFAAGDVAEGVDALTGVSRPVPIFPGACRQGRTAGVNMAGGVALADPLFAMNSIEVFGLPAVSVGLATAEGEGLDVLAKLDEAAGSYRRLVLREGRLVGALFAGAIDRSGIFTGLIRDRVDVSHMKDSLLSDGFGVLALPTGYRKHLVRGEGVEA